MDCVILLLKQQYYITYEEHKSIFRNAGEAIAVELSGLPGAVEARTVRSLGGITANDPDEEMLKLVWPGMKKRWPDAQKMLKRMVIPADDIAAISDQLAGGEGADAVADAWWKANKKAWKPWIAASKNWMKP